MRSASTKFLLLMTAVALPLACGRSTTDGDDDIGGTATETAGESGATTSATESGTTLSTSDDQSTDPGTTDQPTTDSATDSTTDSTSDSTSDSTTDATTDSSTDSSTDSTSDSSSDSTTGNGCAAAEMACDGLDEDCNGIVDDFDQEQDGFCDCYHIGIIGTAGANPAANFEAWLEDKGTDATRFGTAVNHVLTDADLAPYDILIVDRLTHVYSPAERQILADWIAAGHGMITMAGYANNQADRDQQNSLVSASGLSYVAPIYIDPVEAWQNHPIAMGATTVQIYGGWLVSGAGDVFVRPNGEPNNSFGTTVDVGMGKVIVFSDEWISFDSEWQAIPEVPVFWSNMIHWVGPTAICFDPQ